jgi:capsular polysaccharide biosynthesis protein
MDKGLGFTVITSKEIYIKIISDFKSEETYSLVIQKLYVTNDKTTTTQHDLPFSEAR